MQVELRADFTPSQIAEAHLISTYRQDAYATLNKANRGRTSGSHCLLLIFAYF